MTFSPAGTPRTYFSSLMGERDLFKNWRMLISTSRHTSLNNSRRSSSIATLTSSLREICVGSPAAWLSCASATLP